MAQTTTAPGAGGVEFDRIGAGEPLLLIHGTGLARFVWDPLIEHLAPRRDLLIIDLPGHGRSPAPPPGVPHTPPGYASVIARWLDGLGLDRVHIAGNSVGGWTALELGKLGRARSIVALAPAGLWERESPWRASGQLWATHHLGRLFAPLTPIAMRSRAGRAVLLSGSFAKPGNVPPEVAIELDHTFRSCPTFDTHLRATRRERFRDGDEIDAPVTVVWGDKERILPAKARRHDELPASTRYIELGGVGHLMTWDDPKLVARTILEGSAVERL